MCNKVYIFCGNIYTHIIPIYLRFIVHFPKRCNKIYSQFNQGSD